MTDIILQKIEPRLIRHLRQRAKQNGRTVETEITAILISVLMPPPPSEPDLTEPNLATAIKQRFSEVGGVELPEIPREPIRNPPIF